MAGDLIRWKPLRIHCMQHWYNLGDGAMEDANEIASMRLFARYP